MSHYVQKTVASVFIASMALVLTPFVAHAAPDPVSSPSTSTASSSDSTTPDGEQRYIVKYDNNVNPEAESQSLEQKGIEVKDTLSHAIKASVVVATPDEIETVKKSDAVTSVIPDTKVSITGSTSIWGLDRIDQRTGRDGQYNVGAEGAGVDIYIVDTGINFSHTEFTGRITDRYWNINDGNAANDCNGHGTHVAGTAAGTTYGVAKKANIIPVRVLECDGSGWSSTVMAGIDWAIARHVAGQPAVMNMSIGGFTNYEFDQTVQAAINDGITVIAAAGNDGTDACNSSPARVQAAITVAATNINDAQASWSNYGSCVDIQAPGVYIKSAWINGTTAYNFLDGTSMATPHVSGAAAVMLSRDPSLTPAKVQQSIIMSATNNVVTSNKGATPNRFLYLPPAPLQHSCSNLKPGDAWAGVGTHCGLGGSGATALSSTESGTSTDGTMAPALTAVETPAPDAVPSPDASSEPAPAPSPTTAPAPDATEAPAPAPDASTPVVSPSPVAAPVETAPVKAEIPAQKPEAAPAPETPAKSNVVPEIVLAAPAVIVPDSPVAAQAETMATPEASPVPAAASPAPVSTMETLAPVSVEDIVPLDVPMEDAAATKSVASVSTDSDSRWFITLGVFLVLFGIIAIAYAVRKIKVAR